MVVLFLQYIVFFIERERESMKHALCEFIAFYLFTCNVRVCTCTYVDMYIRTYKSDARDA